MKSKEKDESVAQRPMAIASVNRGPFRQRYLIVRLGDMRQKM
jgi:hypothetical protein